MNKNNNYPKFLSSGKLQAEKELRRYVKKEFDRIKKTWRHLSPILPAIITYLNRSGKRTRPILTKASYRGYGGKYPELAILPSVGTEFMHASFIINDDIYDDMPGLRATRGGNPVIHDQYLKQFQSGQYKFDSNWEPRAFSKFSATVAVNLLVTLGSGTIQQSKFTPIIKTKALELYWNIVEEEWAGQGIDILSKSKPITQVTQEEIDSIEKARSAAYSIKFPVQLGATLAGADNKELAKLADYGYKVGLAYQMHDDIMGIFGNPDDTGKVQAELAEGKRTLLIQKSIELGNSLQTKKLIALMGTAAQTTSQLKSARKIIIETGALDWVNNRSEALVNQGLAIIPKLKCNSTFKFQLEQLAHFVINRKK